MHDRVCSFINAEGNLTVEDCGSGRIAKMNEEELSKEVLSSLSVISKKSLKEPVVTLEGLICNLSIESYG